MSPTPESLQERYGAIERFYAEQNWPEVEGQSQALLAELPADPAHPLRQRLLLLLGHTRLYGRGDQAAAARYYQEVLASNPEPALRQIAEQGLQQSGQAIAPAGQGSPAHEAEPSGPGSPAMPWLQASSSVSATASAAIEAVEVVEEPEQIDVALADPSRQDLVTLEAKDQAEALRWPFMPGYVEQRLEGSGPFSADPNQATPAGPDSPDQRSGSTPLQAGAVVEAGIRQSPPPSALSPEQMADLSRGLLLVVIS
jgi:hypothetical protein